MTIAIRLPAGTGLPYTICTPCLHTNTVTLDVRVLQPSPLLPHGEFRCWRECRTCGECWETTTAPT